MDEEAIVKRIIKAYLHFRGEASTKMLLQHLIEVDYGIHKPYSARGLTIKMNYWSRADKSGEWFRVESFRKNRQTWWRLR